MRPLLASAMIGRTTRIFNALPHAVTFEALQFELWVAEPCSFKMAREGLGCPNGASIRACNDQKAVWISIQQGPMNMLWAIIQHCSSIDDFFEDARTL